MRSYIALGIVFFLTGLAMLLVPIGFIKAIVVSLGVAAFANGIYNLITFRHFIDSSVFNRVITIRAIMSLAIGLIAIVLPLVLAGTVWVIISYLIAFYLIFSSVLELYAIYKLKEAGLSYTMYFYEAIVSIIIAAVLIIVPGSAGLLLIRICGALVLLGGLISFGWGSGLLDKFRKTR
ncbi:MAG TPA: DUF308 domain-containing protein [Treponemataceae bacterium]|nr:DUF308 domain-containing protein [Treponemataceae bacterium]